MTDNHRDIHPGSYGIRAVDPTTPRAYVCGTCGRAWLEDTPASRCPWEYDHEPDDDPPADFDEIHEQQGWNDATTIGLLREFISTQGLQDALNWFAQEKAAEENAHTIDPEQ